MAARRPVVGPNPFPAAAGLSRTGSDRGQPPPISTQDRGCAARRSDLPARGYYPRCGVVGGPGAAALANRQFPLGGRSINRRLCCAIASRTIDLHLCVPESAPALLAG